eukprot:scaffold2498_cov74-Cyclotella_meneghiniana.AAC.5
MPFCLIPQLLAYISYGIQCFLFCIHSIADRLFRFNYLAIASTEFESPATEMCTETIASQKIEDKVTEMDAMKALVRALKFSQKKVKALQNENGVLKKDKSNLIAVILSNLSSNADNSEVTEEDDKPQCDHANVDKFRSELMAAQRENIRLTNQLNVLEAANAHTNQLNEAKIKILTEMKAALESQVALLETQ